MKFKKKLFLTPTVSSSPAIYDRISPISSNSSGLSTTFASSTTTSLLLDDIGDDEDPKLLINEFLDSFVDDDYLMKKHNVLSSASSSFLEEESRLLDDDDGDDDKENVRPRPPSYNKGNLITIKNYRLMTLLGKGSFGNVVLAEADCSSATPGGTVAVKILSRTKLIKTRKVHRALTESRCLRLLSGKSPFVPLLLETFKSPTKLYIVQEVGRNCLTTTTNDNLSTPGERLTRKGIQFIAGGELFRLLERKRRLSLEETRFLAGEMLLGLECMHSLAIVYRDLKPENVMITAEGHVKLVDFGLSRLGVRSALRGATSVVGTAEYIAPEMLSLVSSANSFSSLARRPLATENNNNNGKEYGTSVDFWSLGMVIAELLLGLPPWYSTNPSECLSCVIYNFTPFNNNVSARTGHLTTTTPTTPPGEMSRAILRDPFPPPASSLLRTHFPCAHDIVLHHLLVKDPRRRNTDFLALKRTLFFRALDFELLATGKHPPPLVPEVASPRDVSNFDFAFVKCDVKAACYDDDDDGEIVGGEKEKGRNKPITCNLKFDCDETWEGF